MPLMKTEAKLLGIKRIPHEADSLEGLGHNREENPVSGQTIVPLISREFDVPCESEQIQASEIKKFAMTVSLCKPA